MRFLLVLLAAGCSAPAQQPKPDQGYALIGQDPFRFEVERTLLREWGGAGSARFNQVLESELERLRICGNGYVLRNERTHSDWYSVTGRCK